MNIRIISGIYGGRKITAPDNDITHPMGERVRNALFNKIGGEIKGKNVLDAFAGTGSIGIEALSRGADHVTFIEREPTAQRILLANVSLLTISSEVSLVNASIATWVLTSPKAEFDIIIADPPYDDAQFSTVTTLFALLKPGGLMVLSHPGRGEVPTKTGVVVVDNRSYGNAYLTFYRRDDA
jgi:16S rRNA (guanine966-N2)-methyltransferase